MANKTIISAEIGTKELPLEPDRDVKFIATELELYNEKISIQVGIGNGRAKLADIVPPARMICSKINDAVIKNIQNNGEQIPCNKGCSACCKRCLVPLSVPEAFRLKEEIDKGPAEKRNLVWKKCLTVSHHLLTQKTTKQFLNELSEPASDSPLNLNHISNWYSNLKLACPFLHRDICAIYEQRPLACREHFILGSAGGCENGRAFAKVLDMPIRVSNALGQLASELEGTTIEAVILPLSLFWCDENKKRAERTWPIEMMVKRFVEIIEETAAKVKQPSQ